jgi:hypothetical protein
MKPGSISIIFVIIFFIGWPLKTFPAKGEVNMAPRNGAMPGQQTLPSDIRADMRTDIRDIKVPPEPRFASAYIISALAFAILAGAVSAYYLSRKKKEAQALAPYEIAFQALETLREQDLRLRDHIADYYTELTGIIRRYLESECDLRAAGMTTEEFFSEIRESRALPPELGEILRDVMTRCDLVKFAGYEPSPTERAAILDSAQEIIERIRGNAAA